MTINSGFNWICEEMRIRKKRHSITVKDIHLLFLLLIVLIIYFYDVLLTQKLNIYNFYINKTVPSPLSNSSHKCSQNSLFGRVDPLFCVKSERCVIFYRGHSQKCPLEVWLGGRRGRPPIRGGVHLWPLPVRVRKSCACEVEKNVRRFDTHSGTWPNTSVAEPHRLSL